LVISGIVCLVGPPRDRRELVYASPICTVCGVRLNKRSVEAALEDMEQEQATDRNFVPEAEVAQGAFVMASAHISRTSLIRDALLVGSSRTEPLLKAATV
jgi:hypothetical protein